MKSKIFAYIIQEQYDKVMLKVYLKDHLHLSTRLTAKLKINNCILVNDKVVTPRFILNCGDTLQLIINDNNKQLIAACPDITIEILYIDQYLLIVNKPANMPVHPSIANYDRTLINFLAYQLKIDNIHICTRLDHNTSGIVLLALDSYTCERLNNQLMNNLISKKYLAVCEGVVEHQGQIDAPIGRAADSSILRTVSEQGQGQAATTIYKPIQILNNAALLEINLVTGRTHQIRVHMSYIGHPILGDDLYSTASQYIDRQALHCNSISFIHPHTNELISIDCELPDDIKKVIEKLNKN